MTKTYHEGAKEERRAILARVRREIKKADKHSVGWLEALRVIEQCIMGRVERYRAKEGGL